MRERAQTAEEYAGLVDQVLFELEELIASSVFDADLININTTYIEVLLREVRNLRADMADGSYLFGRQDLPFMRLLRKANEDTLPFIRLFYQINATHKQGLDVQND